ncbi:MAG: cell division protein ZapD [Gammaproteobacteria bacterium]|jgi:cell division protein ZapD
MSIIFEQPLNERVRIFLRLEHLFAQLHFFQQKQNSTWHARALVSTLVEIISVFERADIKTEFLKECDRLKIQFTKLFKSPEVDGKRLQTFISKIDTAADTLQNLKGRIGQEVRDHELITAIRHRLPIPGGTCNFDLPQYHYWLNEDQGRRQSDIKAWINTFTPIENTVTLILELIRNSAYEEQQTAKEGFAQKSLDGATPCQLVRVTSEHEGVFPEISGGKHRISIRFLYLGDNGHPHQTKDDVEFELVCCII